MVGLAGVSLAWIALGCAFLCVFSLFRFALNLGFLDRPLIIGMVWAAVTGQWETAVPTALFFELFYLDLFPIGTYIPPHGPFAVLAALVMMRIFQISQPSLAALLIFASMPAAMLGSRLEQRHRQWQNLGYTRMLQSTRPGQERTVSAVRLVRNALAQTCVIQAAGFLLVMALLVPLVDWLLLHLRARVLMTPMTWSHLWMLGTVGALLSLRLRRIYTVFLGMSLVAGVLFGMRQGLL